jgi:hypothetical protein
MRAAQDLKNCVERAVNNFYSKRDDELLNLSVHEQTISHRIAVYLESTLGQYHIDCEYNKHGDVFKKLDKKVFGNIVQARFVCKCQRCREWCQKHPEFKDSPPNEIKIRPDIIVHEERGNAENGNILAIEIKKTEECLFDQEKLKCLTMLGGGYGYTLGVFLRFPNGEPKYKWFINGEVDDARE